MGRSARHCSIHPTATLHSCVTLERLAEPGSGWLAEEAVVVAKHFWRDLPPERIGRLSRVRERRFGETTLTFYATDGAS